MECLVCAKQSVTHKTTGSSSNPRANTGAGSVIVSTAAMRKQLRGSPVFKYPDPGPLWKVWALQAGCPSVCIDLLAVDVWLFCLGVCFIVLISRDEFLGSVLGEKGLLQEFLILLLCLLCLS